VCRIGTPGLAPCTIIRWHLDHNQETSMPSIRIAFNVLSAVCALALLPMAAQADSYPVAGRPITLVVGYPPGGSTDLTARGVAEELGSLL
jgi:hypothetical protein